MQEIKGRISKAAKVDTINDKDVVRFDIVYDAGYPTKDGYHKFPVFYHCYYRIVNGIVDLLTLGTHVSVFGNLRPKPFINRNGEADSGLNFHVDHIDINGSIHGSGHKPETESVGAATTSSDQVDDLPF